MSILISQNFYLDQGAGSNVQPLTHTRIGYLNIITKDNITGPVGVDAFPIAGLVNDQTTEIYKPSTSNAVLNIDLGAAKNADYFGLCGRLMGTVKLEYSLDNITFVEVYEKDDGSSVVSLGLFTKVLAQYWRFTLTGSGQEIFKLNLGESLAMNKEIGGTHTPINYGRVTTKRTQSTEGGQFVGVTISRKGFASSYTFDYMTETFQEDFYNAFAVHAIKAMFFIARDPLNRPKEVGFCNTPNDVTPSYMGVGTYMTSTVELKGFNPESGI